MIYELREDSVLLEKYVRKYVTGKVLDMGTGSGVQAIAAREKTKDILAVDINPECVAYVHAKGIEARKSNLFFDVQERFDWIIFNPPYLPEDLEEPEDSKTATTGGIEGNEILLSFLSQAEEHLLPDGKILLVISSLTGEPEELFNGYSYKCLEKQNLFFETIAVYLLAAGEKDLNNVKTQEKA